MAAKRSDDPGMPRLRFPGFSEEWERDRMGDVYSFIRNNALSRDKLNYDGGTTKNVHYGDIHTKFPALLDITRERIPYVNETETLPPPGSEDYCREGDVIFADASEDTNDVGKSVEIVRLNSERVLSGQHTILARRKDSRLIVGFGGHLFRSEHVRAQIQKQAQGTKVYAISSSRLADIEIAYPRDKKEQLKIAKCMASLEEVIGAQSRKLRSLSSHKRGLMQRLFPGATETVPRLRFPEFGDAPKWAQKKIGDMLEPAVRPIEMNDDDEYSLVTVKRRYGGVVSRGRLKGRAIKVKSQFAVRANDFLISKRQIVHDACGLVPPELDGFIVSNEYSVLTPKIGCDIEFFNYFSQQPCISASFLHSSVGIVIEKMLFKLNDWLALEFPFPAIEEQRRIAGCLKPVECQIAAEAEKLEALKTHRRGLMQQLFPRPAQG